MTQTENGSQTMDRGLGLEVIFPTPRQIMRRRMLRHKGFLFGAAVVRYLGVSPGHRQSGP
jgi:hypothetical protein